MYGYKLHMSCNVGKLSVPLSADVSTANVHDSRIYRSLSGPLEGLVENVLCDPAYDADRKISIEPLFKYLKDMFDIRVLPVKGMHYVKSFVLVCVLVYQLAVYYNCINKAENPRIVKKMLCCQGIIKNCFCKSLCPSLIYIYIEINTILDFINKRTYLFLCLIF